MEIPSVVFGTSRQLGVTLPATVAYPDPFTGVGALTFPVQTVPDSDVGKAFPAFVPEPERYVYEYILQATQWRLQFPAEAPDELRLPAGFVVPPAATAFLPDAEQTIPVIRGWPTFPADVPSIGVALGNESEDEGEDAMGAGYAGDATLADEQGNTLAWASYYAEPLYTTTVVELVHENRDERDRLHNELRRILFPLRSSLPGRDPLVRKVRVDAEKQELPIDEQPLVIYVSLFTVHVWAEMLIPSDVVVGGLVSGVTPTVVPTVITDVIPLDPTDTPNG